MNCRPVTQKAQVFVAAFGADCISVFFMMHTYTADQRLFQGYFTYKIIEVSC